MNIYKVLRVVSDNKNFLVLEVENTITHETQITYVNSYLQDSELYTAEDLKLIWG